MAATRHNLSRRAVLGAGVGACVGTCTCTCPLPAAAAGSNPFGDADRGHVQVHVPWNRTLAAYRRAEARVAAFKAQEALLPPGRREYPACEDLEERFGDLDSRRLNLLRRLLRTPAPNLAALALKLELAVADMAWELTGCDTCLTALAADARRLSANSST